MRLEELVMGGSEGAVSTTINLNRGSKEGFITYEGDNPEKDGIYNFFKPFLEDIYQQLDVSTITYSPVSSTTGTVSLGQGRDRSCFTLEYNSLFPTIHIGNTSMGFFPNNKDSRTATLAAVSPYINPKQSASYSNHK